MHWIRQGPILPFAMGLVLNFKSTESLHCEQNPLYVVLVMFTIFRRYVYCLYMLSLPCIERNEIFKLVVHMSYEINLWLIINE